MRQATSQELMYRWALPIFAVFAVAILWWGSGMGSLHGSPGALPTWKSGSSSPSHKFAYMVTVKGREEAAPWLHLAVPGEVDLYFLCWKDERCASAESTEAISWMYEPGSTWTPARNLLHRQAERSNRPYIYYIFADGDAYLTARKELKHPIFNSIYKELPKTLTGLPRKIVAAHRYWEHQMLEYDAPLVTTDAVDWNCQRWPSETAINVRYTDASLNAIRHDAVPLLLPYSVFFEESNWYASQAILLYRTLCFHGSMVQINGFYFVKTEHADYPKGNPWDVLTLEIVKGFMPKELVAWLEIWEYKLYLSNRPCLNPGAVKEDWQSKVVSGCRTTTMSTWINETAQDIYGQDI